VNISIETLMLLAAFFILAGVAASKVSARFGIPALLLFLVLGMLAGSDGPGGIYFDDAGVAQSLGVIALSLILFSGGLDTTWEDATAVAPRSAVLATLGVVLTAGTLALLTWKVVGLPLHTAVLLGAIVSSTDAAAVLAVLRSKSISLKGTLRPLLEVESGGNDPMALFLTTVAIGLAMGNPPGVGETLLRFVWQFALGGAFGYLAGRAYPWIMTRIDLEYEGLYPVLSLGLVLATLGLTTLAGGNGLLAAYVSGIVAARTNFYHRRAMARFHAGVAWLMQITMFMALGLLVFPSRLPSVAVPGLAIAGLLVFVARPVSVILCTLPFRLHWREVALLCWVGLRGAAPVVLATFPLLAGVPDADLLFHLVFFVVLVSTALQGTTVPYVAKWLGVDAPLVDRPPYPIEYNPVAGLRGTLEELEVPLGSPAAGRSIMSLHLPEDLLVVLVARDDSFSIARGSTVVRPGDRLLVLAHEASLDETRRRLGLPGEYQEAMTKA
jgi:cell volume regulation protein A